jgi:monoamine oxidase
VVSNPDIVIVGAGAAGIGAGLALLRSGISHVILEAKHRVGGRAYTDISSIGHLWDQGCHWFHSADRNVLRFIAEKIGHEYQTEPHVGYMQSFMNGTWSQAPVDEYFVWDLLGKISAAGQAGKDVAAVEILDRGHASYPLIRHWCQMMYSMDPDNISTGDAGNYSDSGINLPVKAGYGALIEKLAQKLPIRLNTEVIAVEVLPGSVRIVTSSGTLEAKACVMAVPARSFETGRIRFLPRLPYHLQKAFEDVPMGWFEKVAISFDRKVLEGFDIPFADIFDPVADSTRPLNFELHPFGRPIAIAHIAGSVAQELSRESGAMEAFALETLCKAFGGDLRKRVVAVAASGWGNDPFIGGAYSCAKPGKASARKAFSEPVHERVFLAGEHVHPHYMATCHGAYETGLAAGCRAAEAAGFSVGETDPLWLAA